MAISGSAQFISRALTASEQNDLLANEPVAKIGVNSMVRMRFNNSGAAGGVVATVASDTRTIQRESPVPAGGTAGVPPDAQALPGIQFLAFAGEQVQFLFRETAAATPTLNLSIEVVPV